MFRTPVCSAISFGPIRTRRLTDGAKTTGVFLSPLHQVVEDGYEFFARRQLVTLFSAPNYCGEFDNAGAMMSVDETLMCSFQILKPAEKRQRFTYQGAGGAQGGRPATPGNK
jgi:hypothetical protein